MWFEGIAVIDGNKSDQRKGRLAGDENISGQVLVRIWDQVSEVSRGSWNERRKIRGDGAKEWTEEKTVFGR